MIETKFGAGLVCPHCGATGKGVRKDGLTKKGKNKNGTEKVRKQRYFCAHCGKHFSVTTGSVMYNSKKDFAVWRKYISYFMHGHSTLAIAEMMHINKNTAFLWRHKICESLNSVMEGIKVSGIVEADETYFRVSYKGAYVQGNRKARKRGSSIFHKATRGLSAEQVCVPTLVNRDGKSVAKVAEVGKGSYKGVEAVIGSHIEKGSTICADGAAWYGRIASKHGLKRVKVSAITSKRGGYSIQHVNGYHSGIKGWVEGFNGVSTKHLNNYLMWFNFAKHAKESYTEKVRIITKHIVCANSYIRRVDIPEKPAIPYICEGVRKIAG